MEIMLNGKPADITLEEEKTVVEVLAGVQQWLESGPVAGGIYVSGIEINGKSYDLLSLDEGLKLPLNGISSLNIKTSDWAELLLEALTGLKSDLENYESQPEELKKNYRERWEQSAPALFLKDHEKDLYNVIVKSLEEKSAGSSPSSSSTVALLSERIREIEDPVREMKILQSLAEETAKRLEDLPLDLQTGKDAKAAETITIFSSLVEKIFRLIFLFKHFGTDIDNIEVVSMNGPEKLKFKDYVGEFSTALKELISAYENTDTILVGDLAEYELAPRLRCLTSVLCSIKTEERAR